MRSAPARILEALQVHSRYGLHTPVLRLTNAVADARPRTRFRTVSLPPHARDLHPLDSRALAWRTHEFPAIAATRKRMGQPVTSFDAMIAAIARSRGAAVATRNVKDFEGCGVTVIDPWRP